MYLSPFAQSISFVVAIFTHASLRLGHLQSLINLQA